MNFRVLLIDENIDSKKPVIDIIGEKYCNVTQFTSFIEGLYHLKNNSDYHVILLDIESNGLDFFDSYYEYGIPIIVMAEKDNEELALNMIRRGAHDYLVKNGVLNQRGARRTIIHAVERNAVFVKNNLESIPQNEMADTWGVLRECRQKLERNIIELGAFNASFNKYATERIIK